MTDELNKPPSFLARCTLLLGTAYGTIAHAVEFLSTSNSVRLEHATAISSTPLHSSHPIRSHQSPLLLFRSVFSLFHPHFLIRAAPFQQQRRSWLEITSLTRTSLSTAWTVLLLECKEKLFKYSLFIRFIVEECCCCCCAQARCSRRQLYSVGWCRERDWESQQLRGGRCCCCYSGRLMAPQ